MESMLLNYAAQYAQNFVASVVVFILLFGAIAYALARDRFGPALSGIALVVLSFFRCPFVYLKAAVLTMADYGAKGEAVDSASKQYLLNKLMLSMQAALVMSSIAILTSSIISGWNTLMPSQSLRQSISERNKAVAQKKTDLQTLEPAVKQMEEAWKTQRDVEMGNFTARKTAKINQLEKENIDLATRINADPQIKVLFAKIEEFHARNTGDLTTDELEGIMRNLNNYMNRLRVPDGTKVMMTTYNDNWGLQKRSKIEINNLSEKVVRADIQPTYEAMSGQSVEKKRDLLAQEAELAVFKAMVHYNILGMLFILLSGALKFILLIWLFGLLIETLWSAINVSTNVKEIHGILNKPTNL